MQDAMEELLHHVAKCAVDMRRLSAAGAEVSGKSGPTIGAGTVGFGLADDMIVDSASYEASRDSRACSFHFPAHKSVPCTDRSFRFTAATSTKLIIMRRHHEPGC